MTYKPHKGSVADRAITYLARLPPGTRIATAPLADELDVDQMTIHSALQPPLKAGAVDKVKVDGLVLWGLGKGVPNVPEDYVPDEPLQKRLPTREKVDKLKAAPNAFDLLRSAPTAPSPAPEPALEVSPPAEPATVTEDTSTPFRYAYYSDGSMDLIKDGKAISLTESDAAQLLAFGARIAGR